VRQRFNEDLRTSVNLAKQNYANHTQSMEQQPVAPDTASVNLSELSHMNDQVYDYHKRSTGNHLEPERLIFAQKVDAYELAASEQDSY